jgi:ATP-dependent exoDNAse (exonuclease V) beta subunit
MLNVYKASAGSGKTYRLAYEYIKMLLGRRSNSGDHYQFYNSYSNPHRRILAVTFTNKATEEMKQRIDPSYSTASAYIDGGFDI